MWHSISFATGNEVFFKKDIGYDGLSVGDFVSYKFSYDDIVNFIKDVNAKSCFGVVSAKTVDISNNKITWTVDVELIEKG